MTLTRSTSSAPRSSRRGWETRPSPATESSAAPDSSVAGPSSATRRMHRMRRLTRSCACRDDLARARAGRPRARAGRRLRVLRRGADAGGCRGPRRLRPRLPQHCRAVGPCAPDLGHHRSVGRRRRLRSGAHRLDRDDAGRQHVPHGAVGRARGARRGGRRRHARRSARPHAQRRVSLRGARRPKPPASRVSCSATSKPP